MNDLQNVLRVHALVSDSMVTSSQTNIDRTCYIDLIRYIFKFTLRLRFLVKNILFSWEIFVQETFEPAEYAKRHVQGRRNCQNRHIETFTSSLLSFMTWKETREKIPALLCSSMYYPLKKRDTRIHHENEPSLITSHWSILTNEFKTSSFIPSTRSQILNLERPPKLNIT